MKIFTAMIFQMQMEILTSLNRAVFLQYDYLVTLWQEEWKQHGNCCQPECYNIKANHREERVSLPQLFCTKVINKLLFSSGARENSLRCVWKIWSPIYIHDGKSNSSLPKSSPFLVFLPQPGTLRHPRIQAITNAFCLLGRYRHIFYGIGAEPVRYPRGGVFAFGHYYRIVTVIDDPK